MCKMGSGLAPQMVEAFKVDEFSMEALYRLGDINKLGVIDYKTITLENKKLLTVVNAYTQFDYNKPHKEQKVQLDYEALTLVMRKINKVFAGKKIGLPMIGAGRAGGNWETIKQIIEAELHSCDVTVVMFNK